MPSNTADQALTSHPPGVKKKKGESTTIVPKSLVFRVGRGRLTMKKNRSNEGWDGLRFND